MEALNAEASAQDAIPIEDAGSFVFTLWLASWLLYVKTLKADKTDTMASCAHCAPQLSWSDRLEYRRSINQAAVVHHLPDPPRVANIRERIGVEKHQIGPLPHLNGTEILIRAEYSGGAAGAGMDRLRRSKPRRDQLLQLHVHTDWNLPDVGPGADSHPGAPQLDRRFTRALSVPGPLLPVRSTQFEHPVEVSRPAGTGRVPHPHRGAPAVR